MAEKFRPVQGLEYNIKNSSPVDGYLYFATDTKKIFLAKEGNYLPMGGNSGIFYGSRELSDEEKEDPELTTFIFSTDDIEGDQVPNVDDLILNTPDGSFYRVTYVDEEQMITTTRLTIAGSGGPGGDTPGSPTIKIKWTDHSPTRDFVVGDKEMLISFSASATNNIEGNKIERIIVSIGAGSDAKTLADVTKTYEFGDIITINIADSASLLNTGGANTLKYTIIDSYGQDFKPSSSFNTIFRLHDLKLIPTFDTIKTMVDETTFKYTCNVSGGNSLERYVQITIAPDSNPNAPIYENSKTKVTKAGSITIPIEDLPIENMQHGVYILTASLCALIDGNRTISSPLASHQIIYYRTEVNTPLIAAHIPSTKVTQYDTSLITYVVIDEQSSSLEVPVLLITEGETTLTANATLKEENIWKKTFNKADFYNLSIQYGESTIKQLPKIEVSEYKGEIPTIDETNLELYLTSQERTNSDVNKEVWEYKGIKAKFDKFLWGSANGWVEDPNGDVALKLTNGAKLTIPEYSPFATNATTYGLTIELDFMLSGVTDYSKPLIHCLSKDAEGNIAAGFNITGQKATLNSNLRKATTTAIGGEEDSSGNINEDDMALQAFTQYYNEDERIHLTYVVDLVPAKPEGSFYFVYTYLNGVLSGIMSLSANEKFENDRFSPAMFEFDSTYGDIYVYNLRVYRSASDSRAVINNYIADLVDIDDKIELYKINKIFTDDGLINIKAIQDIAYQLNVPYVLLKGGSKMPKKFKDKITYTNAPSYELPLTKSDYRLMSMRMYDRHKDNEKPVIDVPIELEDEAGNIINDFKDIQINTSYTMKRGVQVYGQGTSSMVYPVKNLRLKFRKEEDYPVVYDGAYPVEIACFKADFMDSSASHNTGTANLVYDLLKLMNLRSPAQAFKEDSSHAGKDGVAKYDLLTAIRGFPIVCFYTEGDSDDYQYIGRYNFNIDKATPEPFGFFGQKIYTGKTTTDEQGRVRQEVECVGLLTEEVNGMTVLPLDENNEEIERDLIQCWEILNNDTGSPTKFLTSRDYLEKVIKGMGLEWNPKTNYFRQFAPGELFRRTLEYADVEGKSYGWMDYYEDRYPDAMVSGGAFALGDTEEDEYKNLTEDLNNGIFRLACWLNSTALPLEGEEEYVTNEISYQSITPVFYPTRDISYNADKKYYIKNGESFDEKVITLNTQVIYSTDVIGNTNENLDPSKITSVTIDKDIFGEKVDGKFGDYMFVYSTESGTWQFDSKEDIGSDLSAYGISYTGNPEDAAYIKVSYVQTNDWEKTLYEKYTIDNADYRLAKFKAEFTDYIDLKFALFYYTLTMVLLMMDSRAKNMMLATWDQKIWYPIFYDMDTALGLNNTGFNKFAYDTEDDPADKVFNGFDSVLWNNFRTCFYSEICDFYAELRKHLTVGKLLTTYNANASNKWNEALTTADAEYKYIRPYEEGYLDGKNLDPETGEPTPVKPGETSYLYAGQGKRTNHRSYWLTNRANYFDSKYMPLTLNPSSGITVPAFNFRAYALPEQKNSVKAAECVAQTKADHRFTITALNNSYQSIYIGNILYGPEYTLANQKVTLGPSQVKHEVESYILNPSLIANLGDLSNKYLGQFNFPSQPTRLTELNFGRSSRSHPEAYDKYYNNLLSTLSIGESCPYLQKVNIARCTGLRDINLEKCSRLKELDAEGSNLTSITFPSDSIIEKLYLPNSLTVLSLTNQPHLNTIEFDVTNEGKHGASSIRDIRLDRVSNIDTYSIIKAMMANDATVASKDYKLLNVNWTLNSEDDFIYDASGKVEAIAILEKLQLAKPVNSLPFAQALTGTMTIEINKTIDQYAIYDKYNKIFPNLEIIYAESTPIIPAKTIRFFNDSQENNPEEHYYVYTDGTENLQYLVSKEGPKGAALTNPAKASTNENSFKFTGRWESNGVLYTNNPEDTDPNVIQFADCVPETDMNFYAIYETTERVYVISFRDYDDTEVNRVEGFYNESIPENIVNYHYRDSSDLDVYERWAFQGWSTTRYSDGPHPNPIYVDLSSLKITNNMTLRAHYIKEDVRKVATKDEYFEYSKSPITVSVITGNKTMNQNNVLVDETVSYTGYKININPLYRDTLKGKVTLPSMHNGLPIISVGDFSNAVNITHLFFLEGSDTYVEFANYAFDFDGATEISKLVAVYAPSSIRKIGNYSFFKAVSLKDFKWNDNIAVIGENAFASDTYIGYNALVMNELPQGLITLGSRAFYCASREGVLVTKIPSKLQSIGSWAFYPGDNVIITKFDGALKEIGNFAMPYGGKNIKENTIYFGKSVTSIGSQAFGIVNSSGGYTSSYGQSKITNVNFANSENTYKISAAEMGFNTSKVNIVFDYTDSTEEIA